MLGLKDVRLREIFWIFRRSLGNDLEEPQQTQVVIVAHPPRDTAPMHTQWNELVHPDLSF